MAQNRMLSTTAFAGALLCFTLPFMQLSCGPIAFNYSGAALMIDGSGTPDVSPGMDNPRKSEQLKLPKELSTIARPSTIIACLAVVAALIFSLAISAFPNKLAALAGGIALFALASLVVLSNGEMAKPPEKSYRLAFGIGLWLVGIALAIGVATSLKKIQISTADDTTPS